MSQLTAIFDNSLKGITSNPLERTESMRQGSDIQSLSFIRDFHRRQGQNKGRHNRGSGLAINSTTMFRTLFRRDPWVQIPSPALFMGPYGNWRANIAFLSRLICASSETRLTLVSPFCKADCSYNGTR